MTIRMTSPPTGKSSVGKMARLLVNRRERTVDSPEGLDRVGKHG
jgi:hypothetical protein